MWALLRHPQNHLAAALGACSGNFLLRLHVSALLNRGNHLRQLGAIDQCNRVRFCERCGFRGELAIRDHDALFNILGRHHPVKLTYDLNTNAPRLSVLALHKHHPAILSQPQIDAAVRSIFDVVQHQKAFAPERLDDSGLINHYPRPWILQVCVQPFPTAPPWSAPHAGFFPPP
jgi:hypothetical protein